MTRLEYLRLLAAKARATEQWGAEALFRLRADALEKSEADGQER